MKRTSIVLMMMVTIIGFVFAGTAMAGPPKAGKLIANEADMDTPAFEVSVEAKGAVKFLFPVRPDQTDLAENPDIQVFASYAYAKDGYWILAEQDDFILETGELTEAGQVPAYINFPDQGNGWFWVRSWAKDEASDNWVWIDEDSKYCREDEQKRPGYEFLVNPETGETQPVPSQYETRD